MKGISDSLLELLERWLEEHETGQIILNAADHRVNTYELRERGRDDRPYAYPETPGHRKWPVNVPEREELT